MPQRQNSLKKINKKNPKNRYTPYTRVPDPHSPGLLHVLQIGSGVKLVLCAQTFTILLSEMRKPY